MSAPDATAPARDGGFTLVEVLISIVITGMLIAVLGTAISIAWRASPDTTERIDDARSTRGLSTWLAQDTTSTPPFLPERAAGGFDVTASDTGANNDCGGAGRNLLHLQWTERIHDTTVYVANYRVVTDARGDTVIRRYRCIVGATGPIAVGSIDLTPPLDPAAAPVANAILGADGLVDRIEFTLTGRTGEQILIDTSSRNPSEFFPT